MKQVDVRKEGRKGEQEGRKQEEERKGGNEGIRNKTGEDVMDEEGKPGEEWM